MTVSARIVLLLAATLWAGASSAQSSEYSPHAGVDHPTQLLWGDTHVHSSFSMDANSMGNTRLTPADAYRFAKGETVTAASGMKAKLGQPLDFLVVSDHAEYMGLLPRLRAGDEKLLRHEFAAEIYERLENATDGGMSALGELISSTMSNKLLIDDPEMRRDIWDQITTLADQANEPGRFSAIIGYEWTSMPQGDNLHRVVVYADDGKRAAKLVPVSAFDGENPEDLWSFMEKYEAETGGRILAIPHNANMSNGRMFALEDSSGADFDRAYAERRLAREPIVEVTQIKGDGEAHPLLSPDDEFADFETWDFGNLNLLGPLPKEEGMIRYEYAREALKLGLGEAARLGVNPFQFGMIGSTDAHTSLATGAEDDFWGKASAIEPGPRSTGQAFGDDDRTTMTTWDFVASGYAAVWATENTRAAIFDAMRRREVYATTGSRIALRFFGGWGFSERDADRPDIARAGYAGGVPMGGELPARAAEAPTFLVSAMKDPQGANLDRIQIVKGWHDAEGELHERVHDVALSDGRRSFFGRVRRVGSTVDAESASYTNEIGDAMLTAHWQDPDFDPAERAFYYARVIEIPTPRYNTYDALRLGADVPPEVPTEVQDRAYSSPIWYTP